MQRPVSAANEWEALLDALEASLTVAEATGSVGALSVNPGIGSIPKHLELRARAVSSRIERLEISMREDQVRIRGELDAMKPTRGQALRQPPPARQWDQLA